MDLHLLERRIEHARLYLVALEASFRLDWLERYQAYTEGRLSLVEAIALVHPEHYGHLDPESAIRGPRSFTPEIGLAGVKCGVELFWGYACGHSLEGQVVGDHIFPYSLGGPTVGSNKVHLCVLHNQMKSNDVHVFPWETAELPWLPICLKAIRRLKAMEGHR